MTKKDLLAKIKAQRAKMKNDAHRKVVAEEETMEVGTETATTDMPEKNAMYKKANVFASRMATKLENHIEKVLEDAEACVKEYFPARRVSASLTKLQSKLMKEGISTQFDKRVTKAQIKKTASADYTNEECEEAVGIIANEVVNDTEETLEACDNAIKKLASKHFPTKKIASAYVMRKAIEAKLNSTGLNFKF